MYLNFLSTTLRPTLRVFFCVIGLLMSGFAFSQPFTQCPPVQQSPSCAALITINPDGSLTIKYDASVGPYDGVEDTLVGVLNKSGATVYGIALNGNGIFGFDGDGAGTGGSYAPSGVSFSLINASSGIVNFDNGLDDGKSLWFSLEGNPSAVKLKKTVTVDPGHGGTRCKNGKTGATGPTFKQTEHELALAVGFELQRLLQQNNYDVVMTRTTAVCPTPSERAGLANDEQTNIFISLHLDGSPNASANGSTGWYAPAKFSSQVLAAATAAGNAAALGIASNGTKRSGVDAPWNKDRIGVLHETKMSATLVEVAFLSNKGDENVMHQATAPSRSAGGLYAGIDAFFNQ